MSKKVTMGDPIVVYQGAEGDQGWGKNQFPSIHYTRSGKIRVHWAYGQDVIGATGTIQRDMLSEDGGLTWTPGYEDWGFDMKMNNGKYFMGLKDRRYSHIDKVPVDAYTPIWAKGENRKFLADDFRNDENAIRENLFEGIGYEYDPETGETNSFPFVIHWPNAPITTHPGGHIYQVDGWFSLSEGNFFMTEDGVLHIVIYAGGFDSDATSRDTLLPEGNDGKSNVYVFESTDNGRTWEYLSCILTDSYIRDTSKPLPGFRDEGFEGLDEPKMMELANGDFIVLMRTGMSRTMFSAVSSDRGRTWTKPEPFDDLGVLPQLVTLKCGATIATYGRPLLRLRFTTDPLCKKWDDPITVPLSGDTSKDDGMSGRTHSCFYTGLLAVSDNEALFVYTDFEYPNGNGVGVRSILVRKITVIEE